MLLAANARNARASSTPLDLYREISGIANNAVNNNWIDDPILVKHLLPPNLHGQDGPSLALDPMSGEAVVGGGGGGDGGGDGPVVEAQDVARMQHATDGVIEQNLDGSSRGSAGSIGTTVAPRMMARSPHRDKTLSELRSALSVAGAPPATVVTRFMKELEAFLFSNLFSCSLMFFRC